jgi:hypothetical protein
MAASAPLVRRTGDTHRGGEKHGGIFLSLKEEKSMLRLEDAIPLIREIYAYDPTYRDLFQQQVLTSGADVYLRPNGSYFIIPCGIREKVDDCWIVMTLTMPPGEALWPPRHGVLMDWTVLAPRSLFIQFLYDRSEWKRRVRERLKKESEQVHLLFSMPRRDLENLYDHDWCG